MSMKLDELLLLLPIHFHCARAVLALKDLQSKVSGTLDGGVFVSFLLVDFSQLRLHLILIPFLSTVFGVCSVCRAPSRPEAYLAVSHICH